MRHRSSRRPAAAVKPSAGTVLPASTFAPFGALAAGFGFVSLSLAQTVAPAPGDAQPTMPQITVKGAVDRQGKDSVRATTTGIGKGQQELRDVPQSITVVTEKLLDDRNLDTLKDALKNTAGISFQAAEGGEEDIRLRGFSLQSTGDIFIDGLRDPAFYERDSFNWDRLEVLRGSASMLFGRGSTGGAVNQVSKQPLLLDQHEVAVTAGSGSYLRGTGDFNLKTSDDAALRITAMATVAENYGVKIRKEGIAPTYRWGIGTADEFSVGLYYLNNDNGINYGMPWLQVAPGSTERTLLPVDPRNYYGMASDFSRGGAGYAALSHIHRFRNGDELRTAFRAGNYQRDQRASAIRFAAAALQPGGQAVTAQSLSDATVLTRGNNFKIQDLRTKYLQSDYIVKYGWFGFKHAVTTGVDLAHEQFNNYGIDPFLSPTVIKPTTTIGTPNDGATVDESLRVTRRDRSFDAKAFGVYFQDLVQVAAAWKILGGLRWDRFEGRYDRPELPQLTGPATPALALSRTDSLWSKRFGLLFQPTPIQSYHFSYGTSFNTSGDTYQYDIGTVKADPESSRNLELGARLDSADGRFTTRLALFHTTKYNERNRDDTSVTATNYVLSGKRHAAGIELDLAGRLTPAWEVFGSYAYIPDAKVDAGTPQALQQNGETVGERPGLTPRHSGTIWTTYKLTPKWRIGGGLNARSSDKPQGVAAGQSIVAPKFITADLMAEYLANAWSLRLNVTNITDKLYADMLYRGHYIAGKPRTVQLTTAYKF
jgi:catecholate siderophore receptor